MRSSKRYGRRIPETPQEVVDHALYRAGFDGRERLLRWLREEFGDEDAFALWAKAVTEEVRRHGPVEAD